MPVVFDDDCYVLQYDHRGVDNGCIGNSVDGQLRSVVHSLPMTDLFKRVMKQWVRGRTGSLFGEANHRDVPVGDKWIQVLVPELLANLKSRRQLQVRLLAGFDLFVVT